MLTFNRKIHGRRPCPEAPLSAEERAANGRADRFGYLSRRIAIDFSGGSVRPIERAQDAVEWIAEYTSPDGFIYPPQQWEEKLGIDTDYRHVPRTNRPAIIHRLPASHVLALNKRGNSEHLRRHHRGFVMHLLGYVYGTRLQFWDWWFDGRIPIRSTHSVSPADATVAHFISHCYEKWRGWQTHEKDRVMGALFLHGRAGGSEWPWDRFMLEYIVADTLWTVAARLGRRTQRVRHDGRLNQPSASSRRSSSSDGLPQQRERSTGAS